MAAGRAGAPDTAATESEKQAAELVALKVERAGYVARGLDERVAEVNEQNQAAGWEAAALTASVLGVSAQARLVGCHGAGHCGLLFHTQHRDIFRAGKRWTGHSNPFSREIAGRRVRPDVVLAGAVSWSARTELLSPVCAPSQHASTCRARQDRSARQA